jgi:SAM-dependent methyltransferase
VAELPVPQRVTQDRHGGAEEKLGTVGVSSRPAGTDESQRANRKWWNADAADYHETHGAFLGKSDFVWCPEGVREEDARLLGDVDGKRVLEIGCGSASCSRWLDAHGAFAVGLDVSDGMLTHARAFDAEEGVHTRLVQSGAESLPFAADSFDVVCSAFGAVPFVANVGAVFAEVARVLRPGGRWVYSVTHPMRWIFPDVGGEGGLTVNPSSPYFDRTPYVEVDADGNATYVEHHRTLGDYVDAITRAGLVLRRLIEPEWPAGHTREWGQWTPMRGALFPGTAIFCTQLPR